MPTLLQKNAFVFHPSAELTPAMKTWLHSELAINIILKILNDKLSKSGLQNRLYLLQGRTGSGKSTLMISYIYDNIIKNSHSKIMCSEPRVVLTKSNGEDVSRYNTHLNIGENIGILTGIEKIYCSNQESIYYCTSQILNDLLTNILTITDLEKSKREIKKYKIIVIDEVHVLDMPMITLLKTIKEFLTKFNQLQECPLFIFASATIDIDHLINYFFDSSDKESIYKDPLMIGYVIGNTNFKVVEQYLSNEDVNRYNAEEKQRGFNSGFYLVAKHFMTNYFNDLCKSESYVTDSVNNIKVQCRDVLFFIPLVSGIEIIGKTIKSYIKDTPYFMVLKNTTIEEVEAWRNKHRNTNRVLFVGFARGYSKASDAIVSVPIDSNPDNLIHETRIYASTPIIETGKTLTTLYLAIDMGLNTTIIYNPLTYDINNHFDYIRQIPISLNQAIQRLGRIGREAPGMFLHFYSMNIYNGLSVRDIPETVNTFCISEQLLLVINTLPEYSEFDFINENDYIYPASISVILSSVSDLVQAGFVTAYGKSAFLRSTFSIANNWILYAKYLYISDGTMTLWECLLLCSINRRYLVNAFNLYRLDKNKLLYSLKSMAEDLSLNDVVESIQKARNTMTEILYGNNTTFPIIENRIW